MTDYNSLIDQAALAAANERHRQVRMRLEDAQAHLPEAERQADRADEAHFEALVANVDPAASAKALRQAEDAARLAAKTVKACLAAVERSEAQLRVETHKAKASAREAAARDLVLAAADIDRARASLADAFDRYRAAAVARQPLGGEPVHGRAGGEDGVQYVGAIGADCRVLRGRADWPVLPATQPANEIADHRYQFRAIPAILRTARPIFEIA